MTKNRKPILRISNENGKLQFDDNINIYPLHCEYTAEEIYSIRNLKRRLLKMNKDELISLICENFCEDKYHNNRRMMIEYKKQFYDETCPKCRSRLTLVSGSFGSFCTECSSCFFVTKYGLQEVQLMNEE